jgi:hypothetical protein
LYFFLRFRDLSSIDRSYTTILFDKPIKGNLYIKLAEQHGHNMQLKKERKNKIVKDKK